MKKKCTAVLLVLLSLHAVFAQGPPVSGTYLITSGDYIECCGFIGVPTHTPLPDATQAYVQLAVDLTNNRASMSIVGTDMMTVFSRNVCPSTMPLVYSFQNGLVQSNRIVFDQPMPPIGSAWSYVVSNTAAGLIINGSTRVTAPGCADVPTQFAHTNVVASALPVATIRASEVEICWPSILNQNHQVQYRNAFDTNGWMSLGQVIVGNGLTNCITDKIPPGAPRRFYRVIVLP